MGVVVSSTAATSPFFLTTGIIGIISFAFTVSTFLRVTWTNLETMTEAPHEVHAYLTNLRTELLEERASIRVMRKQTRKYHRAVRHGGAAETLLGIELDDVALKTMADSVRRLIRRFKDVETPFLAPGAEGVDDWKKHDRRRKRRRGGSSVSPYYQHSAYAPAFAPPTEKGGRRDGSRGRRERTRGGGGDEDEDEDDDETFWAQRTQYADFSLRRRMTWLWKKSDAQSLFDDLSRVQLRRIARQVGGISMIVHEYGACTVQTQETLRRIDERMNTIVGVRRVD